MRKYQPLQIRRCSVPGRSRFHHGNGLCEHHYRVERTKRERGKRAGREVERHNLDRV